ncbi:MAG: hypothetical protein CM15mL2_0120 [Caudoviricetes sp.]|nr:MAG: hypothetical protein CM15mL2_0120 [Caudoviricetes sp.]
MVNKLLTWVSNLFYKKMKKHRVYYLSGIKEKEIVLTGITQLLGPSWWISNIWIDGKTAVQKAEAQIRMKEATGEIDWELAAIRATQSSWKDEWLTIIFTLPMVLCFCGDWGRQVVTDGFIALQNMPDWYQISLGAIVAASFGIRSVSKFFGMKNRK